MRFPSRIIEHPIESLIAGLLLLALLFGSADRRAAETQATASQAPAQEPAERM